MQAASPNSVNHSHTRRTGRAYNCKSDTAASDKAFATSTQPVQLHGYVYVYAYAFVSDAASDKALRQRLPLHTCVGATTPHQHGGDTTSKRGRYIPRRHRRYQHAHVAVCARRHQQTPSPNHHRHRHSPHGSRNSTWVRYRHHYIHYMQARGSIFCKVLAPCRQG